jgi:WD repeat-containing protein 59
MARRGPSSAFESETFGQDASFRLEQPVGSMSISPSGRDVALASKEGLHIIDLDSPYSPPRYLPHRTPWEVADVQWSPFSVRDYWVVSTSNQKALVWNLDARSWQDPIEFVLHGHTRAITDINFSAHNPDVLATCAVDSFVHCWDLRTPSRPVNSFSDWFAGATQVKWSRQDEHVIASSHDKFLHVWDDRKGAYPIRTIEAHGTKIYGIDWNRHEHNKIVTCSLDKTIKFWNLDNEQSTLDREIDTPFPVWRARHTPFGWGLLVMPQRGQSDLHLYDRRAVHGVLESGPVRPVATFRGHEGQVKEFLWRARGTVVDSVDHRDFQLVSWGTDRELKLHAIEPDMYADIGYEKGISKVQRLNFTRRGAVYKTFRDVPGDAESPLDETPRNEMFPRSSQTFHFRPRSSTSVGMNKVPVAQFRGWVQGGRHVQRSGMHGRGSARPNTDPISWLKNVKISSWDPDTLAEEIRQVGEKFKKVEFEMVDISHRKAVMSLHAPWGQDQAQVFLRLEMRFPKLYPRNANAVLTLQKSGFLHDEVYKQITTELHTIAETYASRKRGCLEALLRYLLKEQHLEQIVSWVLGESLVESKLFEPNAIPAGDDSSDSDDDLDGVREGIDASANDLVPLAKGCGALWSETGTLVCFFPSKSNEPASFLSTLGVKDLEDSQSSRLFEGFGRLHTNSPARKTTSGPKTAGTESDSEGSESSWNSSSSSSSSFGTEQNERGVSSYKFGVAGLHQRSRSQERSNHSTAGDGNKINDAAPRKSALSLHKFDDLIPSKRSLAVDYEIFGSSHDVCKHNADVARTAYLDDLVSVWTLVGLVLEDAVPLEILPDLSHTTAQDISIIARAAMRRPRRTSADKTYGKIKWGNHPLGSNYLMPAIFDHFERLGDVQMLAMLACVFGPTMFVSSDPSSQPGISAADHLSQDDYFPSKAVAKSFFRKEADPDGYVLVDPQPIASSPSFQGPLGGESQRRPLYVLGRHGSQFSSRAASFVADDGSDHASPYSTAVSVSTSPEGNRPSHKSVSSLAYSTARASLSALTQSYSNSPPNQNPSSVAASSLKKFSPSGSLAPNWVSTGIFGSQNPSRASRMLHSSTNGGTQDVGSRSMPSSSAIQSSRRSNNFQSTGGRRSLRAAHDSEGSDRTHRQRSSRQKRIKTRLVNQDQIDLDGYPFTQLVDHVLEQKFRMYRTSYAHLLEVWQLPLQQAEMLKFDGVAYKHHAAKQLPQTGLERPRRKTLTSASRATSPGLSIRHCCRGCGQPLNPIEKNNIPIGWHCVTPSCIAANPDTQAVVNKVHKRTACAICQSPINGLALPCLQCGHVTCYACAQVWFGAARTEDTYKLESRRSSDRSELSPIYDNEDDETSDLDKGLDEHTTCPTGCGCSCATLSKIFVPYPISPTTATPELSTSAARTDAEYLTPPPPPLTHQLSRGSATSTASHATLPRSTSLLVPSSETPTPESKLAAILAAAQSHQRSKSVHLAGARSRGASSAHATDSPQQPQSQSQGHSPNPSIHHSSEQSTLVGDEEGSLNPFAGSKIASLGRGIGAGLSRGLSSKASDATIRRVK